MKLFANAWNWIKVNYFTGSIDVLYKSSTTKTWEEILKNFENELNYPKSKYSKLFIGLSDNAVVVQKETTSGLRWPSDTFHLSADIYPHEEILIVNVNVYLGEFFDSFFPIWKGSIFIITLFLIFVFAINLQNGVNIESILVGGFSLLLFNSICWFATYYLKLEANSFYSHIIRIADKK